MNDTTTYYSTRVTDCVLCGHKADGHRHICPEIWGTRPAAPARERRRYSTGGVCVEHGTPLYQQPNGRMRCRACLRDYQARGASRRQAI